MTRQSAALLILTGGTFMSFIGLLMRLIDSADGFQILFYRSISLSLMVALVACLRRRVSPLVFLRQLDHNDVFMGVTLAFAFAAYVFAILLTSVASTLFILTVTPFMAAVIGWVWIGERPHRMVWVAMVVAGFGVYLMISDGLGERRTLGNAFAIAAALLFAIMLVIARRSRKDDVLGGTFLGGVFAVFLGLICALAIGDGLSISRPDLAISFFMGAFTIGLGIALVTWGTSFVPAAEVSLLVLVESILGPIWVWIFLGEAMTRLEIIGGLIVLSAVVSLSRLGTQQRRAAAH